jgi:hypothetical protein
MAHKYVEMHIRVRADQAILLRLIATVDGQRTDRHVHIAELHRAAVRQYIDTRCEDPVIQSAVQAEQLKTP